MSLWAPCGGGGGAGGGGGGRGGVNVVNVWFEVVVGASSCSQRT